MKVKMKIEGKNFGKYKSLIQKVIPNVHEVQELDTLNIDYSIDLNIDDRMIEKLNVLVEMAESGEVEVESFLDRDVIQKQIEVGRLMRDLDRICEMQSHRRLCEAISE